MSNLKALSVKSLSKKKVIVAISAVILIIGASPALARELPKVFIHTHEFVVVEQAEPVIETNVDGMFVDRPIAITVALSSQEGVKQLDGSVSVFVQIWDDNADAYVNFQTLLQGKAVSLTPAPLVLNFSFQTSQPAFYRLLVEFTATNVIAG